MITSDAHSILHNPNLGNDFDFLHVTDYFKSTYSTVKVLAKNYVTQWIVLWPLELRQTEDKNISKTQKRTRIEIH